MNPITDKIRIGTVGELLVQLRLLEHGVQAATPLKDSGNDLIAVRGKEVRAIQVKTVTGDRYRKNGLPDLFDILAVVRLEERDDRILLDESAVYLIPYALVGSAATAIEQIREYQMTSAHVDALFSGTAVAHA